MERGWDASGLLAPLWNTRFAGPGKRDQLAAATGISAQTLSAYNSGNRPLGITNARRIAAALRVSLAELGAPEGEDESRRSLTLRARIEGLEASLAELARVQALILDELALAVDGEGQPASRKAPARARKRGRRG